MWCLGFWADFSETFSENLRTSFQALLFFFTQMAPERCLIGNVKPECQMKKQKEERMEKYKTPIEV